MARRTMKGASSARTPPLARKVAKEPHPLDVHIGRMVRAMREERGMKKAELGRRLGLKSEGGQIYNYEGANDRISASMLYEMARIFGVPVQSFFEGYRGYNDDTLEDAQQSYRRRLYEVMRDADGRAILRMVAGHSDKRDFLRAVRNVVMTVADLHDGRERETNGTKSS